MKIRLATVCKNEENIMPFFINHYIDWVDQIIIVDGHSTDRSVEIAKDLGKDKVIIKYMDAGEVLDDLVLRDIRNTSWQENATDYDWIISCDNDEFVYHINILKKLANYQDAGITLPNIEGYEMVSLEFPRQQETIISQIKTGFQSNTYSKPILFNPKKVTPNFRPGSHICKPRGEVLRSENDSDKIKLLHYKHLGHKYLLEKVNYSISRFGKVNKEVGYGRNLYKILDSFKTEKSYVEFYNKCTHIF